MTARPHLLAIPSLLFALVLHPVTAAAEPLLITSGTLYATVPGADLFGNLSGNGFLFPAGGEDTFSSDVRWCTPCETVSPTVTLGGTFTGIGGAVGPDGTVDGVFYPQLYSSFASGAISTSGVQLSGSGPTTVTLPFTFDAVMNFYFENPNPSGSGIPEFTREITGTGIATALFHGVDVDLNGRILHVVDGPVRYDFGTAAPVPEPATWLLFSAGAMACSAGRRMRRSRRQSREP